MSKLLKKLLDRLRPESQRRERQVPEGQLFSALALLDDNTPALVAFHDQLHGQFEFHIRTALNFAATDQQRLRALDRAAAVLDTSALLEDNRRAAKEHQKRLTEQKAA